VKISDQPTLSSVNFSPFTSAEALRTSDISPLLNLNLQPNTLGGTAKKITLSWNVGPGLGGEPRKTALEGTLLNHNLGHYCWNRVVTRQPLCPRSVEQQPRKCASTFSSLDVKYCSVCIYLSFVLLHLVLGISAYIVALDFGIYRACYSVCAFNFTPHSNTLGELQKEKGSEPGKDSLLWFSRHHFQTTWPLWYEVRGIEIFFKTACTKVYCKYHNPRHYLI
jgi:hypothetical protein